eukprot:GDKJ01029451.1.p1 GENE.GDKJ01029451.1~~GDKJ01029451.1.p1  ORF type:complete len:523 (+),score=106.33 GDKJ01029451.1:107-1675(+)
MSQPFSPSKIFYPDLIIKVTSPKHKHRLECVLKELFESEKSFSWGPAPREVELIFIKHENPSHVVDVINQDPRILNRLVSNVFLCNKYVNSEDEILQVAEDFALQHSDCVINIRAHPKKMTMAFAQRMVDKNIKVTPRIDDATHVLHICQAYRRFAIQIADARLAPVPVVHISESIPLVVCRALFKVREALYLAARQEDRLTNWDCCPSCGSSQVKEGQDGCGCSCIDIGASPGGWSFYLATLGLKVRAVDPGLITLGGGLMECRKVKEIKKKILDEKNISRMKGIEHEKFDEEEFIADVQSRIVCDCSPLHCASASVRKWSSSIEHFPLKVEDAVDKMFVSNKQSINVMVCDMNLDPRFSANMLLSLTSNKFLASKGVTDIHTCANGAKRLGCKNEFCTCQVSGGVVAPHALLVFTLKETSAGLQSVYIKQCRDLLSPAFDVMLVRQLLTNGLETTLIARRRALPNYVSEEEKLKIIIEEQAMIDFNIQKCLDIVKHAYDKHHVGEKNNRPEENVNAAQET